MGRDAEPDRDAAAPFISSHAEALYHNALSAGCRFFEFAVDLYLEEVVLFF
jgi:hypothetical protein